MVGRLLAPEVKTPKAAHVKDSVAKSSSLLDEAARKPSDEVFQLLGASPFGLSEHDAATRLEEYGPNEVAYEKEEGWLHRLYISARNPLVILLTVLAILSYATGDATAGTIMMLMVALGMSLRFVQETRADNAAAKLKAMITVTATVIRDGQTREIPLRELVPGDVVKLSAGDMIPGDVRLISAKDLFVIQATLTGESLPVEKNDTPDSRENLSSIERTNLCFLGTSVESGSASAAIVATGAQTYFGKVARSLAGRHVDTAFDKGVKKFTWLMIRFMLVMVPLVFLINGFTKHDWKEAFFFALAVAVGLTPEMLPMIVSVCLSKGALAMSRKKVIVKQLNSIQNFGAMDVLCTDKTGTLTIDRVILEIYCDVFKNENEEVLRDAYLISHFQTGLKNVLDRAVLKHAELHGELGIQKYVKLDEIPFDFSRRMMSVAVEGPNGDRQLLTKGAPEAVFSKCTHFESEGEIFEMEPILVGDLLEQVNSLNEDGLRVLAIATKKLDQRTTYSKGDECDLILTGYIAFLDPPKETAAEAITALRQHGVNVKVLTGDNDLVARKVCSEVGINAEKILLGRQVESMSDTELADAVEPIEVFARLSPSHKQRVVKALQEKGHVVGFMGDGINDAPALRAADVGISVDNAVDIAKESADMILLEKSLMILEEGVLEGRKVFVNILKYIRMGASSNFGNMFSVIGASAWLPFVPMAPIQVLTNNLLYDFSQVPIPTDNVGPQQTATPRPWNMGEIAKFIVFIGPISSIFDYTTYAMMWFVFKCNQLNLAPPAAFAGRFANAATADATYAAALFHTGWFVESLMTQTLIVHVIRTNLIPFIQSRASWQLTATTVVIMAIGAYLPFSPLAVFLGFVPLPPLFWLLLLLTLLCYVALTQVVKVWLLKKSWI
ncbi:MAG TPA: magnesium-translocating P-type ATPase [Chthoniobacterales bacterium]|jgi:Mg2+-importing ATPase|nr:magnesium-translocating P-type ATPase [Chthoniobacterales bacterium]